MSRGNIAGFHVFVFSKKMFFLFFLHRFFCETHPKPLLVFTNIQKYMCTVTPCARGRGGKKRSNCAAKQNTSDSDIGRTL